MVLCHGVLAFSDGGYRSPDSAAIGWMIFYVGVVNNEITLEPMAAEAIYLTSGIRDSFESELIALDTCLDYVNRYVKRRSGAKGN